MNYVQAAAARHAQDIEDDRQRRASERLARFKANPELYAERRRQAGLPAGPPLGAVLEPSKAELAELHAARCISEITDYCKRFNGKRDALKEELNIAFQGARMGLKVIRWSAWA